MTIAASVRQAVRQRWVEGVKRFDIVAEFDIGTTTLARIVEDLPKRPAGRPLDVRRTFAPVERHAPGLAPRFGR